MGKTSVDECLMFNQFDLFESIITPSKIIPTKNFVNGFLDA